MKNLSIILVLFILATSCQTALQTVPQTAPQTESQSDMWHVKIISAEQFDSLTATISSVQYGGDITETTNEYVPADGNAFLLLNMEIEKIGAGKASFTWSDVYVVDSDGNKYYRHSNDTFIANLEIPRLKGTDIVFGKEQGFACFEIPKNTQNLQFVADNGNIKIKIVM